MNPFRPSQVGRRLWVGPALLVAAGVMLAGIYRWQAPNYRWWKGGRALAAARAALIRGDVKTAELSLDVALRTRGDAEVYDTVADYLERIGSERALDARLRAAAATPGDAQRRLAVAETALRLGDSNAAHDALAGFSPAEQSTERYRRVAAAQAMLAGDFRRADALLSLLGDAAVTDHGLRLTRDAIWAQDANPARRGAAALDLERLSAIPQQRLPALRIRLATAFRVRDPFAADELGRALAAAPGATFADLLDAAAAERFGRAAAPADPALMNDVRSRASKEASLAVRYSQWIAVEDGGSSALAWLDSLAPVIKRSGAVLGERARLCAARADWTALRTLLLQGAWGSQSSAAIDLAYAAFALHRRGNDALAERAWSEALGAENADSGGLEGLAHLAAVWRWPEAVRQAFSETVRLFPAEPALYRRYATYLRMQGDSRGLLAVAGAGGVPAGDNARTANWALLSFLVAPAAASPAALAALKTLAAGQPDNPYYLTGYAFALWRVGRAREAAAVADRLAAADRVAPDRAPYLAAIYAGAGRLDEARAALARAPRASALLPEEAKLVADAYARVAR